MIAWALATIANMWYFWWATLPQGVVDRMNHSLLVLSAIMLMFGGFATNSRSRRKRSKGTEGGGNEMETSAIKPAKLE